MADLEVGTPPTVNTIGGVNPPDEDAMESADTVGKRRTGERDRETGGKKQRKRREERGGGRWEPGGWVSVGIRQYQESYF